MVDNRIRVWDIVVRVFHWSLVLAFTTAYVTEEELLSVHVLAGYAVGALIVLRLVWGFIGSRHARFSDFLYAPAEVKRFLSDTAHLRARRYLGHNPAGGVMILLMLTSLLATTLSGLAIYGIEEAAGPLAAWAAFGHWEDVAEGLHVFFANFTLVLVVIHVAGVLVESVLHRENLAKAMITGYKRAGDG